MSTEVSGKQELRDQSREYIDRFREYILIKIETEKRLLLREKSLTKTMKQNSSIIEIKPRKEEKILGKELSRILKSETLIIKVAKMWEE
jgi:hypothetical protein